MKDSASLVRDMYEALSWYVQLENWRAHGTRFADFTLHKALAVPDAGDAPFAGTRHVNDVLLDHAGLCARPRVLDAGCGFGGTMFRMHERFAGTYDGITVSPVQVRVARAEARRRGIEGACRFHLRDFDAPIGERYDAVVAIESLSHAPDLRRTLANLSGALEPGGTLLIAEDMAVGDIDSQSPDQARELRAHWGCRRFPREGDYEAFLPDAGLEIVRRVDLTALVRHRGAAELDSAARRYAAWFRWLPAAPLRRVLSAYIGGVALETLYARKQARYRLLVARKPRNACSVSRGASLIIE